MQDPLKSRELFTKSCWAQSQQTWIVSTNVSFANLAKQITYADPGCPHNFLIKIYMEYESLNSCRFYKFHEDTQCFPDRIITELLPSTNNMEKHG